MHYADHTHAQGYDLIGDVHGCANALIALLTQMGYRKKNGVYRHHNRQAVFVGDIVDRGPHIRQALHIVHDMVEHQAAQMVLGNHEFNLLACFTKSLSHTDNGFLREQTPRRQQMMAETLTQFAAYPDEFSAFLDWFKSVPLLLNFRHFRVVHACWDQALIDAFIALCPDARLSDEWLQSSETLGTLANQLINRLTRGVNVPLPDGHVICSEDGYVRQFFRAAFWHTEAHYYSDVFFQPDQLPKILEQRTLTSEDRAKLCPYPQQAPPLFFGHYWRSGTPTLIRSNLACLDYSAVKYGKLVAYRMDKEQQLDPKNFVWVDTRS